MMDIEEKLQRLYIECINELNSIGITFKDKKIKVILSKRNNKRYGCCKPNNPDENYKKTVKNGYRYVVRYYNFKEYTIEISKWVMELDDKLIKNTIIHELIHCLPYCNNHGIYFKKYANEINNKLSYNISRTGNKKEDFERSSLNYEENENYKYKIECKKCGQIFYRKRLNKNFKIIYRCSKCLGNFEVYNLTK